jgi:hypothetical protein
MGLFLPTGLSSLRARARPHGMPNRIPQLLTALAAFVCSAAIADSCGAPVILSYEHGTANLTEQQRRLVQRALAPYQNANMQIESLLIKTMAVSAQGKELVPEQLARRRAQTVQAHIARAYPELSQRVFVEVELPGSNAAQGHTLLPHTVSLEFMCSRRNRFTAAQGMPSR